MIAWFVCQTSGSFLEHRIYIFHLRLLGFCTDMATNQLRLWNQFGHHMDLQSLFYKQLQEHHLRSLPGSFGDGLAVFTTVTCLDMFFNETFFSGLKHEKQLIFLELTIQRRTRANLLVLTMGKRDPARK